ncbi:MAG: histidine phosphatase family protein [Lachnospiraceae bacterium]|jgi:probable phosphoglycerate mutase|nr:histidine phosphatase family protein [Lachnospiraceae bacterium]MBQ3905672.1 histidine phosphatase family protein [Lachnospiraceae bacterium]
MRIIIVRHGEPNYVKDCLTPLGIKQAKAAAQRLKSEGIEEIYSSPMGRARQTAQETADLLGISDVKILDFMHEVPWGKEGGPMYANGHPWMIADRLVCEGWDLHRKDWPEHEYFRENMVTKAVQDIAPKTDEWLETLGYRREGMYYRCIRKDEDWHTVALFCHGGSSTAMLAQILNLTFPYLCGALHLGFTGIATVRLTNMPGEICVPHMELMGDQRHILGVE